MVAGQVWLEAFPDIVVKIRRRAMDGPCVALESVMRGIHTGPLRLQVASSSQPSTAVLNLSTISARPHRLGVVR